MGMQPHGGLADFTQLLSALGVECFGGRVGGDGASMYNVAAVVFVWPRGALGVGHKASSDLVFGPVDVPLLLARLQPLRHAQRARSTPTPP